MISRFFLVVSTALFISCAALEAAEFKFDFGAGKGQPGYTQVTPQTTYDAKRGFGFLQSEGASPEQTKVFAVDVAEGNYDVTIRFGDPASATSTTIKAESRRLMIEKVDTTPGKYDT